MPTATIAAAAPQKRRRSKPSVLRITCSLTTDVGLACCNRLTAREGFRGSTRWYPLERAGAVLTETPILLPALRPPKRNRLVHRNVNATASDADLAARRYLRVSRKRHHRGLTPRFPAGAASSQLGVIGSRLVVTAAQISQKRSSTLAYLIPLYRHSTSFPHAPRISLGGQLLSLSASFHDRHRSVMRWACSQRFFAQLSQIRKRGKRLREQLYLERSMPRETTINRLRCNFVIRVSPVHAILSRRETFRCEHFETAGGLIPLYLNWSRP